MKYYLNHHKNACRIDLEEEGFSLAIAYSCLGLHLNFEYPLNYYKEVTKEKAYFFIKDTKWPNCLLDIIGMNAIKMKLGLMKNVHKVEYQNKIKSTWSEYYEIK